MHTWRANPRHLGVGERLRQALANYTENGGKGETAIDQEKAVEAMQKHLEICRDFFHPSTPRSTAACRPRLATRLRLTGSRARRSGGSSA